MGNTFGLKGLGSGFESARLVVEISDIIFDKACGPNPVVDLFDADDLAGEDLAEVAPSAKARRSVASVPLTPYGQPQRPLRLLWKMHASSS